MNRDEVYLDLGQHYAEVTANPVAGENPTLSLMIANEMINLGCDPDLNCETLEKLF